MYSSVKVKYLAKEVEELKLRNDDLQKGLDNYKQAYESQKIITASAKNDIKELKKTLGLFKPHEIELAMGRRKEEEQAELEQAQADLELANENHQAMEQRIERAKQALMMDEDIVASVYDWTKDRERLESKRRQLAALIKEIGE